MLRRRASDPADLANPLHLEPLDRLGGLAVLADLPHLEFLAVLGRPEAASLRSRLPGMVHNSYSDSRCLRWSALAPARRSLDLSLHHSRRNLWRRSRPHDC